MKWLHWWLAISLGRPIIGLPRQFLQKKLSVTLTFVGLEDCRYTLGSMPSGGATHHFQRFRNFGRASIFRVMGSSFNFTALFDGNIFSACDTSGFICCKGEAEVGSRTKLVVGYPQCLVLELFSTRGE